MRLVVACCWPPDKGQGISTVSREIAEALVRRGNEIYYLSPQPSSFIWYEATGIKPIIIGPEQNPVEGLRSVVMKVNNLEPDAIINNDHPYVQSALPALKTRKIIISHTMAWGTAALVKFNHEWADNIIAISYDMINILCKKGVSPEKLSLIMNGVTDPYTKNWQPGHSPDKPLRIVFAGNWTHVKGADYLLDAINQSDPELSWLQLDCFGSMKKKQADILSDKSWVTVHNREPRDKFLKILSNADILLLPSRIEGCPVTVIEAMSHGVIPIVSDGRGAMKWMVDHGLDGFVARRKYWCRDMWSILKHLQEDRDLVLKMKNRARQRFLSQFQIDLVIDSLLELADRENIERGNEKVHCTAINWHRPGTGGIFLHRLIDRVYYKLGYLRKSGVSYV